MLFRIAFFLFFLTVLTDWYIYVRFVRRHTQKKILRLLAWLPTFLLMLAQVLLMVAEKFTDAYGHLIGLYLIIYMAFVIPKVLFCLFAMAGQGIGRWWRPARSGGYGLGLVIGLWSLWVVLYGTLAGWKQFETKAVTFACRDLPEAFDGYRIVQISDLHIGTIAQYPREVQRLVDSINAQRPDLICFTGDLVNHRATELDGTEHILSKLRAKDGVYAVLGNHDFSPYIPWPTPEAQEANVQDLIAREERMGWHVLNNEHVLLHRADTCIALLGVQHEGYRPLLRKGDLPRAMQGTDGLFRILLSHDPTHWRREVLPQTDIQLMLSGHTHAMQFKLFGFTPSMWFFAEHDGLYREDGQGLYVNTGIGEVMLPFRYGAWPEITVLTLRKE